MTQGAALRPGRIYAIADAEALAPRGLAEGAFLMAQSGITTIQLRAKHLDDATFFDEAERCLRLLEDWQGSDTLAGSQCHLTCPRERKPPRYRGGSDACCFAGNR